MPGAVGFLSALGFFFYLSFCIPAILNEGQKKRSEKSQ